MPRRGGEVAAVGRTARLLAGFVALALVLAPHHAGAAGPPPGEPVRLNVLVDPDGDGPAGPELEQLEVRPGQLGAVADALAADPDVVAVGVDRRVSIANDPFAPQQYALGRIRSTLLPPEVAGSGVTVAVVDTGVHGAHEDLAPALSDGRPRVATGRTFLTGHVADGTRADVDPNGHGTHAAGIIAAARGNGIGVAGIAPEAQVLPVRALDEQGRGWTGDLTNAVKWAHDQGADVINLSLTTTQVDPTLNAMIQHVTTDTGRGKPPSIVVAAAGNTGTATTTWPAAHPRTLAVGASDAQDLVAGFSTRGSFVDLAAPGVQVGSTCAPASGYAYCTMSGTSMAAPHVSAVAALLRAEEPTSGPDQVRARLEATAHDIATLGRDTASGAGRVDAAAAVRPQTFAVVARVHHPPTGSITSVTVSGKRITVTGTASDREGTPKVRVESTHPTRRSIRTYTATGNRFTAAWDDLSGTHRVCVSVLDVPFGTAYGLGCRDAVVK